MRFHSRYARSAAVGSGRDARHLAHRSETWLLIAPQSTHRICGPFGILLITGRSRVMRRCPAQQPCRTGCSVDAGRTDRLSATSTIGATKGTSMLGRAASRLREPLPRPVVADQSARQPSLASARKSEPGSHRPPPVTLCHWQRPERLCERTARRTGVISVSAIARSCAVRRVLAWTVWSFAVLVCTRWTDAADRHQWHNRLKWGLCRDAILSPPGRITSHRSLQLGGLSLRRRIEPALVAHHIVEAVT